MRCEPLRNQLHEPPLIDWQERLGAFPDWIFWIPHPSGDGIFEIVQPRLKLHFVRLRELHDLLNREGPVDRV